nr:arsenate reductase ArsC [Bacteroidota bacterium]
MDTSKKTILILCTGNSCRSQMAEGFLRSYQPAHVISSAGTNPEKEVNPIAVKVMSEVGIDIGKHQPEHVDNYVSESFDYVITVCDNARETCPHFSGKVKRRLHIGFEDPADARGNEGQKLSVYRKIRDQISEKFKNINL